MFFFGRLEPAGGGGAGWRSWKTSFLSNVRSLSDGETCRFGRSHRFPSLVASEHHRQLRANRCFPEVFAEATDELDTDSSYIHSSVLNSYSGVLASCETSKEQGVNQALSKLGPMPPRMANVSIGCGERQVTDQIVNVGLDMGVLVSPQSTKRFWASNQMANQSNWSRVP